MNQKIAILSDPHFHDPEFAGLTRQGDGLFVRTLADTVASTRVFNESSAALRTALDDIAARGITIVVIVGDLTDDGQAANWLTLDVILSYYADRHGMQFYATPGNHDQFGPEGKHQAKRALNADGSFDLISSSSSIVDPKARTHVVEPGMYCLGYADAIGRNNVPLGYRRARWDLHWETPFGLSEDLADRQVEITSEDGAHMARVIDASYLAEPVDGLWLLSLDANVYVPNVDGTSFSDRNQVGWNAAIRYKPYLLEWAADVVRRAREQGKRLLTFSHYPVTDISELTLAEEEVLRRGKAEDQRRMPNKQVSDAFLASGLPIHFSGHWHINATGRYSDGKRAIVNVAVPSMVALPAAYKIVSFSGDRLDIETVSIRNASGFDVAFPRYRREAERNDSSPGELARSESLDRFLDLHQANLASVRYLPREWPDTFDLMVGHFDLEDIARLANHAAPVTELELEKWRSGHAPIGEGTGVFRFSFADLFADLYRFRKARGLAPDYVPADRIAAYRQLIALYAGRQWPEECVQNDLAIMMRILARCLDGLPSVNFSVDLRTGELVGENFNPSEPSAAIPA